MFVEFEVAVPRLRPPMIGAYKVTHRLLLLEPTPPKHTCKAQGHPRLADLDA